MTEAAEATALTASDSQVNGASNDSRTEGEDDGKRKLVAPENWFCAHRDVALSACASHAEDGSPRPAVDLVLKNLAAPTEREDGVADLVKRWALCVEEHQRMRLYDALRWYDDCIDPFVHATTAMGDRMVEIVTEYTDRLPGDERLSLFGQALGVADPEDVSETAVAVADEAHAACGAFLRGDWNCVTKLGAVLLSNAFQSSDPEAVCMSDANLRALYGGIDMLSEVLALGFSETGWRFCIEYDRVPLIRDGGTAVAPASVRDRVKAEIERQRKAADPGGERAATTREVAFPEEGSQEPASAVDAAPAPSTEGDSGVEDAAGAGKEERVAEAAAGPGESSGGAAPALATARE